MALHAVQVLNPTATAVTVGSNPPVHSNEIWALNLDDTTTDVWSYLAAGCVLLAGDVVTVDQRENIGYKLLHSELATGNPGG